MSVNSSNRLDAQTLEIQKKIEELLNSVNDLVSRKEEFFAPILPAKTKIILAREEPIPARIKVYKVKTKQPVIVTPGEEDYPEPIIETESI